MFDKMLEKLEKMMDSETINKMIAEKQEEIKKLINKPINVKIVNKSNNPIPEYATEGSAGMDVRAYITKDFILDYESKKYKVGKDVIEKNMKEKGMDSFFEKFILFPGERALIPTGLYFELPEGFEMQIRPRSGLAIKNGISIVNSPGTLDSDYRGELGIILINHGKEEFTINNGDRISQIVISKYQKVEFEPVDELGTTERGEGGFNSTGIK